MKVKELIEKLSKCDPQLNVCIGLCSNDEDISLDSDNIAVLNYIGDEVVITSMKSDLLSNKHLVK